MYPKHILVKFEDESLPAMNMEIWFSVLQIWGTTGVPVLAETTFRSSRKLFIFIIKQYIYRIKASKIHELNFEKKSLGTTRSWCWFSQAPITARQSNHDFKGMTRNTGLVWIATCTIGNRPGCNDRPLPYTFKILQNMEFCYQLDHKSRDIQVLEGTWLHVGEAEDQNISNHKWINACGIKPVHNACNYGPSTRNWHG